MTRPELWGLRAVWSSDPDVRRKRYEAAWRDSRLLDAIDVEHAAGCRGPRPDYTLVGWDAGGAHIGRLTCPMCSATLELLDDVPVPAPERAARPRGRPPGRRYDKDALVAEYRRVKKAFGRKPTEPEFCASADPRIEPRTLQDYLTAYGLPWPIE